LLFSGLRGTPVPHNHAVFAQPSPPEWARLDSNQPASQRFLSQGQHRGSTLCSGDGDDQNSEQRDGRSHKERECDRRPHQ
jgi:hypothetical protein